MARFFQLETWQVGTTASQQDPAQIQYQACSAAGSSFDASRLERQGESLYHLARYDRLAPELRDRLGRSASHCELQDRLDAEAVHWASSSNYRIDRGAARSRRCSRAPTTAWPRSLCETASRRLSSPMRQPTLTTQTNGIVVPIVRQRAALRDPRQSTRPRRRLRLRRRSRCSSGAAGGAITLPSPPLLRLQRRPRRHGEQSSGALQYQQLPRSSGALAPRVFASLPTDRYSRGVAAPSTSTAPIPSGGARSSRLSAPMSRIRSSTRGRAHSYSSVTPSAATRRRSAISCSGLMGTRLESRRASPSRS